MKLSTTSTIFATFVCVLLGVGSAGAIDMVEPIDSDPLFTPPTHETLFAARLIEVWGQALARPEADLRRDVLVAVVKAHGQGMDGLEVLVERMVVLVENDQEALAVRLAAVRALVALDAQDRAEVLFQAIEGGGLDLAFAIEPALAAWDYRPMRDVWLARLEASDTPRRRRMLAIEGVARVDEPRAAGSLLALIESPRTRADIRIAAGRALGRVQREGSEARAERLLSNDSPQAMLDRLVGVLLLAEHGGDEAVRLLLGAAVDVEPTVSAIALERLLAIDPDLVEPINARIVASGDARVRQLAAEILRGQGTPTAVEQLARLLDDPHPDVRRYVADSMVALAEEPALDASVRASVMGVLADSGPYGLEQAALVMGALDHEPSAERLVALLDGEAGDASVAAAWALCQLAVPETAPAILEHVRHHTDQTEALAEGFRREIAGDVNVDLDIPPLEPTYGRLRHLLQALSVLEVHEADGLLRRYFPKPPLLVAGDSPQVQAVFQYNLRAAAMWSLGHLHEGQPDDELAKLFTGRLRDENPTNPEDLTVRRQAAVAMGRMHQESAQPALRAYLDHHVANGLISDACAWAMERITGESFPRRHPKVLRGHSLDWVLEPLPE